MKTLKLGKKAARHDARTLMMAKYMAATALPPIESMADWTGKITAPWGMDGNDTVGDCTIAGVAHALMLWTGNAGSLVTPNTAAVIGAYSDVTGYNGNPSTDQGADLLTVLNYWRNNGLFGHKIQAFSQIDLDNQAMLRASIALFGCAYVGVQLPASAMTATQNDLAWTDTSDNNIEGGHCILLTGYTPNCLTCITWGQKQDLTWDWWSKYGDEAYCVLSPDWIGANGQAPDGFNLEQLTADLGQI